VNGEVQLPENYRPITILLVLHKLVSRVLYHRIEGYVLTTQSVDQAGFTPGSSCNDNLSATPMLVEQCAEWETPLWLAAVDF